jgi:hypothetical protein
LALPAGAAPPVTSITNVTVTGTATVTAEGTGDCLWRMEVTIENFRGGGKSIYTSLGSPAPSYYKQATTYVKGNVTSFVWETRVPVTVVDTWVVRADNKKGTQYLVTRSGANIVCGT